MDEPELLTLLQHKKRLFYKNKLADQKSAETIQQYRAAKKTLKKAIKKILEFEMNLASDKKNPQRLYAYINSKQNISCAINSIMIPEGTLSTHHTVIAENLNRQFASVFADEPSLEALNISKQNKCYYRIHNNIIKRSSKTFIQDRPK